MARVKWIKLFTDLFEDEKILMLNALPGGESKIIIWLKLLCLAGKINDNGAITFDGSKPYTPEMLSKIFKKPLPAVINTLDVFEEYGMISRENGVIKISSWRKFQNVDALNSIRKNKRKNGEGKRKEERRDIEMREERKREGEEEGEGEGEGEKKEKVLEKESGTPGLSVKDKRPATPEEIRTLFPSLILDTTPTHTYLEYSSALSEYNRSDFAKKSFLTLSLLDRHLSRLRLGFYADYAKTLSDTSKMCMPQTYTKEEIDSVFRNVADIDVDNWDI